jgi:hypothetical protein
MLSSLLFVVSLVTHSGFVNEKVDTQLKGQLVGMGGQSTGGLIVKMGPVMNLRVADVRVISAEDDLPAVAQKGSLFEGFSKSRLFAVRYAK